MRPLAAQAYAHTPGLHARAPVAIHATAKRDRREKWRRGAGHAHLRSRLFSGISMTARSAVGVWPLSSPLRLSSSLVTPAARDARRLLHVLRRQLRPPVVMHDALENELAEAHALVLTQTRVPVTINLAGYPLSAPASPQQSIKTITKYNLQ